MGSTAYSGTVRSSICTGGTIAFPESDRVPFARASRHFLSAA